MQNFGLQVFYILNLDFTSASSSYFSTPNHLCAIRKACAAPLAQHCKAEVDVRDNRQIYRQHARCPQQGGVKHAVQQRLRAARASRAQQAR